MPKIHIPKKVIKNQQYDNYWKLTVEYTDIFDLKFNNTLKMIVTYIDNNDLINKEYNKNHYALIQKNINCVYEKSDLASVRKSINQFVKLGFIKPFLKGYHTLTKRFLNAKTPHEKQILFSKIFYEAASFNSSVTTDDTKTKQINFVLKTLTYHPKMQLSKEDIVALMVTPNISSISKGYLNVEELKENYEYSKVIGFESKKYNQIAYMFVFMNLMDNIIADKNIGIRFKDKHQIEISTERDPYLYSIFKSELEAESIDYYGMPVCYMKKQPYKGLVHSHIKDSAVCLREGDLDTAYDYNNGILLSQECDAYFDKFDISFNDDGSILINPSAFNNMNILNEYEQYKLDCHIMNSIRKQYMKWHREKFNQKMKKHQTI